MNCTCGSMGLPHTIDCAYYKKEHIEAHRNKVTYRYDTLYWSFIHAMAEIGAIGAEKYGEFNYQKTGLIRDKSPINHIANHLKEYIEKEPYDHDELGNARKYHLAAIAFNAMMQYWHEDHPKDAK